MTSPALAVSSTPTHVLEYESVKFDVARYLRSTKLQRADIARTLHISVQQLDTYRMAGRMPRAVQRLMFKTWGREGFAEPASTRQTKPFRLVASAYGPYVHAKMPRIEPPAPPVPAPIAKPETVTWTMYESTVSLLLHQSAALLAEKAIVEARNLDLEKRVDYLENQQGFARTLDALDRTRVPLPVGDPSHRADVVRQLQSIGRDNGNAPVITDLQKRIGSFQPGSRQ